MTCAGNSKGEAGLKNDEDTQIGRVAGERLSDIVVKGASLPVSNQAGTIEEAKYTSRETAYSESDSKLKYV